MLESYPRRQGKAVSMPQSIRSTTQTYQAQSMFRVSVDEWTLIYRYVFDFIDVYMLGYVLALCDNSFSLPYIGFKDNDRC